MRPGWSCEERSDRNGGGRSRRQTSSRRCLDLILGLLMCCFSVLGVQLCMIVYKSAVGFADHVGGEMVIFGAVPFNFHPGGSFLFEPKPETSLKTQIGAGRRPATPARPAHFITISFSTTTSRRNLPHQLNLQHFSSTKVWKSRKKKCN